MDLREFAVDKLAKELRSRDFHTRSDGKLKEDHEYRHMAEKQILTMDNLDLLSAITPDFNPDFRIQPVDNTEARKLREKEGIAFDEARRRLRLERMEDATHQIKTVEDAKILILALIDWAKRR